LQGDVELHMAFELALPRRRDDERLCRFEGVLNDVSDADRGIWVVIEVGCEEIGFHGGHGHARKIGEFRDSDGYMDENARSITSELRILEGERATPWQPRNGCTLAYSAEKPESINPAKGAGGRGCVRPPIRHLGTDVTNYVGRVRRRVVLSAQVRDIRANLEAAGSQ
jgi:hypothetical protein